MINISRRDTDTVQSSVKMNLLVDPQIILDLTHHYIFQLLLMAHF